MHVDRGCRASFVCNEGSVQCESWGYKHATCECTQLEAPKTEQKFTVMAEGEFSLAKANNFDLSVCSDDISEGRVSTKKLTWNRDFQITDSGVKVMVDGGASRNYMLTIEGSTPFTPVNLGVHTTTNSWACDPTLAGHMCRRFIKNEDVEVQGFRKHYLWDKHNGFDAYHLGSSTPITDRKCRYQTDKHSSEQLGRLFRTQTGTLDACEQLCEDTEGCTRYSFGTDRSSYDGLCMGCTAMPISRLTIKFPKTNRLLTASIATWSPPDGTRTSVFGQHQITMLNLALVVPTPTDTDAYSGFCAGE
jgi:hypothetical protein